MPRLNISKARHDFPKLVKRAARAHQRTVVARRGKDMAAIVPMRDLHLLERLSEEEMDRQDLSDARAALEEPGDNVSWDTVKADLGL